MHVARVTFHASRLTITGFLVVIALSACATTAHAQLISPGELTRAHQDLQGIRNCTSCHTLGNKGIDNARCLECHEPLKTRIDAGRGYHATLADKNCAECHKEHFGVSFQLIRFDTTQFDHGLTGFQLTGAHEQAACRSCHRASRVVAADVRSVKLRHGALDRTYLGLGTRCLNCHEPDSPHAGQFRGDDCQTCHTTERWEEASGFEHDATRFRLVGRHRQVDCRGCHPQATAPGGRAFTRYEGIAFTTCASCHDDAHGGAFGADCASCHTPADWHQVRNLAEGRFDHAATGFTLAGRHAQLSCQACHARPARQTDDLRLSFVAGTEQHTYPRIRVEDCRSCHVDYHDAVFAETEEGSNCAGCHTEAAWVPVTYDLERHNSEARFALTGAHLATPCTACHRSNGAPPSFRFAGLDCHVCHTVDNPHRDEFSDRAGVTACGDCHTPDGWSLDTSYDHDRTDFTLTGKHADTACSACHTKRLNPAGEEGARYRGLSTECRNCHADDDPHAGQFDDRSCDTCHNTASFRGASVGFDHSRTRFPLDGAHRNASCRSCHVEEITPEGGRFVRYKPLGTACKDCHSSSG